MSFGLNEWELLVAAEDIEQGDAVDVELEDGSTTAMIFQSATSGSVKVLDQDGKIRRYSTSSLEELQDGGTYIVGKSAESLDAREILGRA